MTPSQCRPPPLSGRDLGLGAYPTLDPVSPPSWGAVWDISPLTFSFKFPFLIPIRPQGWATTCISGEGGNDTCPQHYGPVATLLIRGPYHPSTPSKHVFVLLGFFVLLFFFPPPVLLFYKAIYIVVL